MVFCTFFLRKILFYWALLMKQSTKLTILLLDYKRHVEAVISSTHKYTTGITKANLLFEKM